MLVWAPQTTEMLIRGPLGIGEVNDSEVVESLTVYTITLGR